jgi:predicted adenylyl cyclase CyaB
MEIELKFLLENPEETINQLNKISKQIKESHQKDIYFIPPHRDFIKQIPVSEWLRLRETENKSSINYKRWHNTKEKKAISCDEFETEISDINDLKNILKSLDFKEIIIVEKLRKVWIYKDTEIAIDKVTDLGYFIEIEAKKELNSIKETDEYLRNILEELNIKTGEQDFEGYPYLLLKKKNLV